MNNIYLIVGKSGVGKSTVCDILRDEYGYKVVESYTDRPPRYKGERGHIFVTADEFDRIALKGLVAYTFFDGHRYGVTEDMIDKNDIYIIDVDGVKSMRKLYRGSKHIEVILLDAPEEVLKERMTKRGDDSERIKERLEHDKERFADAYRPGFRDISFTSDEPGSTAFQIYLYMQCCEDYSKRRRV